MNVTIFKDILTVTNPYIVDIAVIYERIKNGKSKEIVEKIRKEPDKKIRTELKKMLPSICFSGIFERRANNAIIQHSGLVCIDFDHVNNLNEFKETIKSDVHTFISFVSPSGDGLKVVIKIPANIETHAASCKSLKKYYKSEKLDNFEDVARVCFESYDPDIYMNKDSDIYEQIYKEETVYNKVEKHAINSDYDIIFNNLKTWIEKYDIYQDGNKHKFLVKFAGALNRFGVPEYVSIQKLSYNYKYAASTVNNEDFETIVKNVFSKYSFQNGISFFEKNSVAYEKSTKSNTPDKFFDEYKTDLIENKYKEILFKTAIDIDKPPIQPPVILAIKDKLSYSGKRIMTLGNMSAIIGKYKSKKTFFHSMVSASLVANYPIFSNIIPSMPEDKRNVLLFDTEQSEWDVYNVAHRIKRLANTDCANLGVFSWRGMDSDEIINSIDYAVNYLFQNVGLIVIDQIADLVTSLNDEREANKIVKFIEKISKEKLIHVCCIIHQNKANDYAQGWTGTNIMKKSETVIKITKDPINKNISHVESDAMRSVEFEPFSFIINGDGYPEIVENNDIQSKNDFDM